MRNLNRASEDLRDINFIAPYINNAEGSCFVQFGETKVVCTATVEERVPHFLRNSGRGWVTAEYGMLPRATTGRTEREAVKGRQTGRTQEIQRLIGRSLRSVIDFEKLGERQIKIDCDVIQADGGTRTASICGGYVALCLAIYGLLEKKILNAIPIIDQVAGISCGLLHHKALLDLDYQEDSQAEVDANFVITGSGKLVEVQATAEGAFFTSEQFFQMLSLAEKGVRQIVEMQKNTIKKAIGK